MGDMTAKHENTVAERQSSASRIVLPTPLDNVPLYIVVDDEPLFLESMTRADAAHAFGAKLDEILRSLQRQARGSHAMTQEQAKRFVADPAEVLCHHVPCWQTPARAVPYMKAETRDWLSGKVVMESPAWQAVGNMLREERKDGCPLVTLDDMDQLEDLYAEASYRPAKIFSRYLTELIGKAGFSDRARFVEYVHTLQPDTIITKDRLDDYCSSMVPKVDALFLEQLLALREPMLRKQPELEEYFEVLQRQSERIVGEDMRQPSELQRALRYQVANHYKKIEDFLAVYHKETGDSLSKPAFCHYTSGKSVPSLARLVSFDRILNKDRASTDPTLLQLYDLDQIRQADQAWNSAEKIGDYLHAIRLRMGMTMKQMATVMAQWDEQHRWGGARRLRHSDDGEITYSGPLIAQWESCEGKASPKRIESYIHMIKEWEAQRGQASMAAAAKPWFDAQKESELRALQNERAEVTAPRGFYMRADTMAPAAEHFHVTVKKDRLSPLSQLLFTAAELLKEQYNGIGQRYDMKQFVSDLNHHLQTTPGRPRYTPEQIEQWFLDPSGMPEGLAGHIADLCRKKMHTSTQEKWQAAQELLAPGVGLRGADDGHRPATLDTVVADAPEQGRWQRQERTRRDKISEPYRH